jgi:osmoprotectant transport system ATP-binding protein
MPTPAKGLAATAVHHRYGNVMALDGISLTVDAGECVALVGESGSGKTTLLRCFNQLVVPDTGAVAVLGEAIGAADPVALRRRIGYVPQDGGLLPHWSVERNAALVATLNGRPDARARALAALEAVGLAPAVFGARWPSQLSGGQRQRVAIARAIADRPAVILLDEPFGALDAITRTDLHALFLQLRRDLAATVLLVTHDLREATRLADRVAVLRAGRLEQVARVAELLAQPATPYVAELLHRAELR